MNSRCCSRALLAAFICSTCLLGAPGARAAGGKKIAVLDFAARGVSEEVAANVTDVVAAALALIQGYAVISNKDIVAMIDYEQQKQMLGCDDPECVGQFGHMLGADYLVSGAVGRLGDKITITISTTIVRTGAPLGRSQIEVGDIGLLAGAARQAVSEMMRVKVPLRQITGKGDLFVASTPEGARIYIDGVLQQAITPAQVPNVIAGDHVVRLAKDDMDRSVPVLVAPDKITKLNLSLAVVRARFLTVPFDATVFINGIDRGTTPLLIPDLAAARHRVELRKKGYKPYEEEVLFELTSFRKAGGEAIEIKAELRPQPLVLRVDSRPSDAVVFLDGDEKGTTPLRIPAVLPGARTLRIQRNGYRPTEEKVAIRPGEKPDLNLDLAEYVAHRDYVLDTQLRRGIRSWGIIAGGVAAAVGGGLSIGGWMSDGDAQRSYQAYMTEINPTRLSTLRDQTASQSSAAFAEAALGYTFLGIGAALFGGVLLNELLMPAEPAYAKDGPVVGEPPGAASPGGGAPDATAAQVQR